MVLRRIVTQDWDGKLSGWSLKTMCYIPYTWKLSRVLYFVDYHLERISAVPFSRFTLWNVSCLIKENFKDEVNFTASKATVKFMANQDYLVYGTIQHTFK